MPNGANYVSESFWDLRTFTTLFLWLIMLVTMCLPAITAYRHRDKKQMWISLLCGLTGMSLLVPWLVSVVMVLKKYQLPSKGRGAVNPLVFTGHGAALIILGGVVLINNYTSGISHGVSLIIYGAGVLIASLLPGKGYWGGLMLMSSWLISSVDMELFELPLYLVYEVLAIIGVGLIIWNVLKTELCVSTAQKAASTEAKAMSTAAKGFAAQVINDAKKAKASITEKAADFIEKREAAADGNKGGTKAMKLQRCPNGHFYDGGQYGECCPYCAKQTQAFATEETTVKAAAATVIEHTAPTAEPIAASILSEQPITPDAPVQEQPAVQTVPEVPAVEKSVPAAESITASVSPEQPITTVMPVQEQTAAQRHRQPVVGWLVCIGGIYKGESFILKEGRNFIGRSEGMDIRLDADESIAFAKQASVIYEPKSRSFILAPGDVHELCYLNGEVALYTTVMNAYDTLDMGSTSMMLIPCCGERFSWENGLSKG